jgi:Fe-S oxidoreductase
MRNYPEREPVSDQGLDQGILKLTPEKIQTTIQHVLKNETAARLKTYVKTCVHCGLCSNACHFYNSHDGDPKYAPVSKVKDTMWEILRKDGNVSPEFIRQAARIAFTECNVCRRCSMYCPFGIDLAYMMLTIRRICHLLGVVPQYLQDTVNSHSVTSNQMWVKPDEWIDTLQWQEEEQIDEIAGARIPLDKEGADIMYSVIGPEPKFMPQLIGQMDTIMTVAGMDWTMPSLDGWDNSNMAMYSGDFEIMARVERAHYDKALELRVKKIVMGECGHAFRGAAYDGPKWLGWKEPPVPLIHAVQFYHDLIFSGKLKIIKKFDEPTTVQDPCNIVRGRGLGRKLRDIMNAVCSDFRDVDPRFEHNYCCASGGGVINCGPPWKNDRVNGNRVKGDQLKATGAKIVVTPCHNCHSGIEDIIATYKLGMHTKFFSEILVECIEIPEHLKA